MTGEPIPHPQHGKLVVHVPGQIDRLAEHRFARCARESGAISRCGKPAEAGEFASHLQQHRLRK